MRIANPLLDGIVTLGVRGRVAEGDREELALRVITILGAPNPEANPVGRKGLADCEADLGSCDTERDMGRGTGRGGGGRNAGLLKQGSQCRGVVKAALGVEEVPRIAFLSRRLLSVMWEDIPCCQ